MTLRIQSTVDSGRSTEGICPLSTVRCRLSTGQLPFDGKHTIADAVAVDAAQEAHAEERELHRLVHHHRGDVVDLELPEPDAAQAGARHMGDAIGRVDGFAE